MSELVELYRKYRPQSFSEVVGQSSAVAALTAMGKSGTVPHVILFTGPSGCGKTTLARILRRKLKCGDMDFIEMNSAEARGIDEVRKIQATLGAAPTSGPVRVYLIDECHAMTPDAQNAILKTLEDTPSHVYFFLCTTDPAKMKSTVLTRCTEVRCKAVDSADLEKLVKTVVEKEGKKLHPEAVCRIAEVAEGSARMAMVILHRVLGLATHDEVMAAIESTDVKGQAINIARALMNVATQWKDLAKELETVEEDAEALRRMILGYCKTVLLRSGSSRAALVIEEFREPLYNVGMPGFIASCWAIVGNGR